MCHTSALARSSKPYPTIHSAGASALSGSSTSATPKTAMLFWALLALLTVSSYRYKCVTGSCVTAIDTVGLMRSRGLGCERTAVERARRMRREDTVFWGDASEKGPETNVAACAIKATITNGRAIAIASELKVVARPLCQRACVQGHLERRSSLRWEYLVLEHSPESRNGVEALAQLGRHRVREDINTSAPTVQTEPGHPVWKKPCLFILLVEKATELKTGVANLDQARFPVPHE